MKFKLDKQSKTALFIILGYTVLLSVLAYFRFAIYDEKLYLHETAMMAEILKNGEWIGRYGVGVHGFLFKLPVALVYLITGPSIYVATFFHIILSALTSWAFYHFAKRIFKNKPTPIIALVLLLTNFAFLSWSTTFHREIPVLFTTMLFIYVFTKKDFKYKILISSILLMLVLDAKEYVFFILLPAVLVYLFLLEYLKKRHFLKSVLETSKKFVLLLIPAILYLYLMFYTNLLPINMFNASLLGFTEDNFSYQIRHTLPTATLSDMSTTENNNILYSYNKGFSERDSFGIIQPIISVITLPLSYIEKFFYISNFSLQSIPVILLIPSFLTSIFLFIKWKSSRKELLFLNLFYWSFLLVYTIRTSHERYILPLIPIYILFLLMFFVQTKKKSKKFEPYLKVSLLLMLISTAFTLFYQSFSNQKELFNIFISIVFTILFLLYFYLIRKRELLYKLIIISIVTGSLFIISYAQLTKNQLYLSRTWGINGEADKIAELLDPEDVIFVDSKSGSISEFTALINFYRATNYPEIEWNWKLDKTKRKRDLEENEPNQDFFSKLDSNDLEDFREQINNKEINKIVLLESTIEDYSFPLEEHIEELLFENWLELEIKKELKNKILYIFTIIE